VATGELIWEASGLLRNVIPMPVTGHGMVLRDEWLCGKLHSGHQTLGARRYFGHRQYRVACPAQRPYVASPILSGDRLYVSKSTDAFLSCLNAGHRRSSLYQDQPLEGLRSIYASPVAANGYLYVVGREGMVMILKDAAKFEIVATNKLSEKIDASPVMVDEELFPPRTRVSILYRPRLSARRGGAGRDSKQSPFIHPHDPAAESRSSPHLRFDGVYDRRIRVGITGNLHHRKRFQARILSAGGKFVRCNLLQRRRLVRRHPEIPSRPLCLSERSRIEPGDIAEEHQRLYIVSKGAGVVMIVRPQVDLARRDPSYGFGSANACLEGAIPASPTAITL